MPVSMSLLNSVIEHNIPTAANSLPLTCPVRIVHSLEVIIIFFIFIFFLRDFIFKKTLF